jgi:hypothetical protein
MGVSFKRPHPSSFLLLLFAALGALGVDGPAETAARHHQQGVEHHLRRALDDASREYARALALDPPRDPTAEELHVAQRFAPRLHTTPTEPFPLKDAAAVMHPAERLIAYHLFWDDDIDFPEDNDPCDHEVVWVQYSADRQTLERVWTYFHGRILAGGEAAMTDARAHAMRPRVDVQWGKHGSMPAGWEQMSITIQPGDAERPGASANQSVTLAQYNEDTFSRLSRAGRRLPEHPLARRLGWPDRFTGTNRDFVDFSRVVDLPGLLARTRMVKVSQWNSATINQHFLTYNFRPKTEWPIAVPVVPATDPAPALAAPQSIEVFQLPPKSVFDNAMPRYPNAWFYVDRSLAPSYQAAVNLVTTHVRESLRAREFFGPFDNAEGCDFEVRLEHLQPWEPRQPRELRPLTHAHAFHLRYYFSALEAQRLERVTISTSNGAREFYRVAASVHYEVEHANPHHADVEMCPVCGRTGDYAHLTGSLVEQVHDPLGLELLLTGKVRGEAVRFDDYEQREVGGIAARSGPFSLQSFTFPAQSGDRNTLRIGIVVIAP